MRKGTFLYSSLLGLMLSGIGSPASVAKEMTDMDIVVLRTIDKVSAYTHTFEIPVDKTVKFGSSLFIKARACRKSSPIETPEDAAFLQIWERKPEESKPNWVFSGWMFSSNPSVSGIEHPVYDVWVIECKNEMTSKSQEDFTSEQGPDEGAAKKPSVEPEASSTEDKPEPAPATGEAAKPFVPALPTPVVTPTPAAPATEDGAEDPATLQDD